jgi:hypothetical protein
VYTKVKHKQEGWSQGACPNGLRQAGLHQQIELPVAEVESASLGQLKVAHALICNVPSKCSCRVDCGFLYYRRHVPKWSQAGRAASANQIASGRGALKDFESIPLGQLKVAQALICNARLMGRGQSHFGCLWYFVMMYEFELF